MIRYAIKHNYPWVYIETRKHRLCAYYSKFGSALISNKIIKHPQLNAGEVVLMLCHLGELIPLLASTFACRQSLLWHTLRQQIETIFDQLKHRTDPQRWTHERTALLHADWPVKSFLRMRLSDTSDDAHGTMANPLREPA